MTPFTTAKIAKFFENRLEFLARGEDHIHGKLITVKKLVKDKDKIHGLVDPGRGSTKNKTNDTSYSVEVYYNDDGPTSGSCTCPIGKLRCSHMAALLLWAQTLYSKTDFQQEWNRPSNRNIPKDTEIQSLWPQKSTEVGLASQIDASDLEFMATKCDRVKQFGVHFLLQPPIVPPQVPTFLRSVEDWISDQGFSMASDKVAFIRENIKLTPDAICKVAEETKGQGDNPLWLQYRKFRLTSSNFGFILKQIRVGSFPQSFWKRLFGAYNLDRVQSIIYGKAHEKDGVEYFEKVSGKKVKSTGICMHADGNIGASPDGLIEGEDSIIEVKCAYSHRNSSLAFALNDKKFYLEMDSDDSLRLKESHDYYHQVQGTLHLTNRKWCYFTVWTPLWCTIVMVERNDGWRQNIDAMKKFYFDVYLQKMLENLNQQKS